MSGFLLNLARRGAGLPVTPIQAPMLSPFSDFRGGLMRTDQEASAEAPAEPAAETNPLSTPGVQRYSTMATMEAGAPIRLSIREPATAFNTAPQPDQIPFMEETQPVPVGSPVSERLAPSYSRSDGEAVAEIPEERGGHVMTPAAQAIESAHPVISIPPPLPKGQIVSTAEKATERLQEGSQATREAPPPAPAIRPAAAESPLLLHFPKPHPTSTPPPAQLSVHVRIGRVEVRGTSPQTPAPAAPSESTSLGFASYYRRRNYRS